MQYAIHPHFLLNQEKHFHELKKKGKKKKSERLSTSPSPIDNLLVFQILFLFFVIPVSGVSCKSCTQSITLHKLYILVIINKAVKKISGTHL